MDNRQGNWEEVWASQMALRARKAYLIRHLKVGAGLAVLVMMISVFSFRTLEHQQDEKVLAFRAGSSFVQTQVDGMVQEGMGTILQDWEEGVPD